MYNFKKILSNKIARTIFVLSIFSIAYGSSDSVRSGVLAKGGTEKYSVVRAAIYANWNVPPNYQLAHGCLKYLRIDPFTFRAFKLLYSSSSCGIHFESGDHIHTMSFEDVFQQYWLYFMGLLVATVLIFLVVFYVIRLNRRLRQAVAEQKKEPTAQRRAEEKLIEKEKELRLITESSLDTIFVITKTGKIIYISPSAKELFGFELDEIIGTSFTKYVPKKELPKYWKNLKDVFLHKKVLAFETSIISRHGNIIPVEINGQLVEKEGKLFGQGAIRDIRERKQAEQKLRLFSQAVETSVDGVAMGNTEGKITYVNEAFVKMFGYSREELIGKEFAFIYPEDQMPKLEQAIKETITKGGWTGELVGRRKDGELFPMEISSSTVVDNKGNVITQMANHRDITERKQAEEALKKKNEELMLFNKLSVGRELKMIELKKEINALLEEMGKEPKYKIAG